MPATAGRPPRLVLVPATEKNVSRKHLLLEPLDSGRVRVNNESGVPLKFDVGPPLAVKTGVEKLPPFTIRIARWGTAL